MTYSSRFLRFVLSVTIAFLCIGTVPAQDKDWRPVTQAELAMTAPSVEPDADVEAIFWEVRIDDSGNDLSRKHYVRVKIFTERGREKYSKFDIPFTRYTKIKDLKARVIKADGSIIEVGKDDIFEREVVKANNFKVKSKSFAVPGIEPGVIVEYRYKEVNEYGSAFGSRLQFQRDIPVQTLVYYYKPDRGEPQYQNYNFSDVKFTKDEDGYYLAQRRNVPALKEEPLMPPEDNVRAWMLLTGSSRSFLGALGFSITFVSKDPKDATKYWGGVAGQWSHIPKYMSKGSDDIKRKAEEITAGTTDPESKIRKLYEFCQGQISNTTYDIKLTPDQRAKLPKINSLGDVLKNKSASSWDINLLFGAMASSLGFESRIAFVGDRSQIFFDPLKMVNERLIHVGGVAVGNGENWTIHDPGDKYVPYGMRPWWEEDTWALLIGEKNYLWRRTPVTPYSKTQARRMGKFRLLEDGTLEGDVKIEYTGHYALNYRLDNYDEISATREERVMNEVKADVKTAEVSAISIDNVEDTSKPLVKQYKIRVPNYAQRTGKRIFFQPGFFEYGKRAVFSSSTRIYDIFFRYPWSEVDEIDIQLPPNFVLDSADSPADVADPKQIGSLKTKIGIDNKNNLLRFRREFYFGGGDNVLFGAATYQPLKNLFDAFTKADSLTITLKVK